MASVKIHWPAHWPLPSPMYGVITHPRYAAPTPFTRQCKTDEGGAAGRHQHGVQCAPVHPLERQQEFQPNGERQSCIPEMAAIPSVQRGTRLVNLSRRKIPQVRNAFHALLIRLPWERELERATVPFLRGHLWRVTNWVFTLCSVICFKVVEFSSTISALSLHRSSLSLSVCLTGAPCLWIGPPHMLHSFSCVGLGAQCHFGSRVPHCDSRALSIMIEKTSEWGLKCDGRDSGDRGLVPGPATVSLCGSE